MADYIETHGQDGSLLRIEVESIRGATGFGREARNISNEAVQEAYQQMLNTIRGCADGVIATLQNLEALPSAARIDFAIKIDAEAGAMVAKNMNEAQFKISLSWKQVESEPGAAKDS